MCHLELLMHLLFHGSVQFSVVVVQSDNIFLNWNAVINFELVDKSVDPDHIFSGVTTKILFESCINQVWVLIQEFHLSKIVDGSVAKIE